MGECFWRQESVVGLEYECTLGGDIALVEVWGVASGSGGIVIYTDEAWNLAVADATSLVITGVFGPVATYKYPPEGPVYVDLSSYTRTSVYLPLPRYLNTWWADLRTCEAAGLIGGQSYLCALQTDTKELIGMVFVSPGW